MASNQPPSIVQHDDDDDDEEETDYIDMEVSSSNSQSPSLSSPSNSLCNYSVATPPETREFEFQMSSSVSHGRELAITSPADELFYKGKLLPLHLPPRLQMVQKLLQHTNNNSQDSTSTSSGTSTPLECCRVNSEVNPDECFFEWPSEANGFVENPRKLHSLYKKLKQIKNCHLGQKIKASRAYLKYLFNKSGCSDESSSKAAYNGESESNVPKAKVRKMRSLFGHVDKAVMIERRSFSGAIQCSSSSSDSSSSSSFSFTSSNGYHDLHLLKRTNSANSQLESSVEGAIAHCKQSNSIV